MSSYLLNLYFIYQNPNNNIDDMYYLGSISIQTKHNIGIFLLFIVNWNTFFMFISLIRTIISDPGYFSDPVTFEGELVKHNTEFPLPTSPCNNAGDLLAFYPRKPAPTPFEIVDSHEKIDYMKIVNEDDENNSILDTRFAFIRDFSKYIKDGPLTYTEYSKYRKCITKFLDPKVGDDKILVRGDTMFDSSSSNHNDSTTKGCILNFEDPFSNFSGVDFSKLVLCTTCLRWKVERSHHCRICGKCILKMDHHCPWLANCIGFKNYKFFCLLILYGWMTSIIIFFTFWEAVSKVSIDPESTIYDCVIIVLAYVTNLFLLTFLTYLLFLNIEMIFSGQTIIEKSDKERFPTNTKAQNIYDLGWKKNFIHVFGEKPFFWFFPLFPNLKGNGILYETNERHTDILSSN